MNYFLWPLLLLPIVMGNPLQLNLLSTPNASSIALANSSALNTNGLNTNGLNTTGLTSHNDCYEHSEGYLFTTTKSDCEKALDRFVAGKSLTEIRYFSYKHYRVTDQLPVEAEYGSCNIALMTFDLDTRISMTYAEIYAELLGPDGVLKECLGSHVPAGEALGGQTSLGPGNRLVAEVTGQPKKRADQKTR